MATNGRREKLFENVEGSINGCPHAFHGCGEARIDQPPYVKLDVKRITVAHEADHETDQNDIHESTMLYIHSLVYGNRPTPFSSRRSLLPPSWRETHCSWTPPIKL